MPRVLQVIETERVIGKGEAADPMRTQREYYTVDGELLGRGEDPYAPNLVSIDQLVVIARWRGVEESLCSALREMGFTWTVLPPVAQVDFP